MPLRFESAFYCYHRLACALLIPIMLYMSLIPNKASAADSGPVSALVNVQKAIDESDSDVMNQSIDLNSVLNKASDTLMASLQQQIDAGTIDSTSITMALSLANMAEESGKGAFVKQLLLSEVRGFVTSGVNGGYFAGKPNGKVKPPRASLASTLEKMPRGRREIIPGKILSNKDGKASVAATFVDPEAGRLPLVLAVEQQGNDWRITEISNASELFEQASKKRR